MQTQAEQWLLAQYPQFSDAQAREIVEGIKELTMSKPKPDLATTKILGMDLPIIADLGDGWFLAAHPNGAVIASETCLSVLWGESTETAISWTDGDDEDDDEGASPIPEPVRAEAVKKFEALAWPLVRGQFYSRASD